MKNVMLGLIENLKTKYGIQVRYARYDNSRENENFEQICKQEWMDILFEDTTPGTPQQKSHVEQKFATLFNRLCAMFNDRKFSFILQNILLAEINNMTFKPISTIFWEGKEKHSSSVQKFVEMYITTYWNNSCQAKLANHGPWAFRLVMLKVTQSVPTMCTTPRQKK